MAARPGAAPERLAPAELAAAEARRWLGSGRAVLGSTTAGRGSARVVADVGPRAPAAWLSGVSPGWSDVGGLPSGCLPVAAGRALALAALAAARAGTEVEVEADAVTAAVLLPLVVAAATGTPPAARPPRPWPTADGAVCADLGAEGDEEAFRRLLEVVGAGPVGAEELAQRAQEWRLPVTPYRRRPRPERGAAPRPERGAAPGPPPFEPAPVVGDGSRPESARRYGWPPLAGLTVVDLTVMWSGPLCTALLAALGAQVLKVEPDCRPDGTRASPEAALFRALNTGKEHVALDLRRPAERNAFFDLVAAADLVVDNFSPRVAVNLGIDDPALRAINPGVCSLHLPAFPPGPQRHWVSYGTGIHAVSGLGEVAAGTRTGPGGAGCRAFVAPAVTYPDPLGGLAGAVTALALFERRDRPSRVTGKDGPHAEVPLVTAVAPLPHLVDLGSLTRPPDPGLAEGLARRFGPLPPPPFVPPEGRRPPGFVPPEGRRPRDPGAGSRRPSGADPGTASSPASPVGEGRFGGSADSPGGGGRGR